MTRKAAHRSRGTSRARALTIARSDQVKRGRATWRRSTASWWRSTRISASLAHGIHPVDPEQLDDAADETVEEGERHGRRASLSLSCLVKLAIE